MIECYAPGDLEAIALTPEHRAIAEFARETLSKLSADGFAWTSYVGPGPRENLLAIMVAVPHPTGCEVAIFPSVVNAKLYPKILFKDVRSELLHAHARFGYVRSVTKLDALTAENFLRHLGFAQVIRERRDDDEFIVWGFK